MEPSLFCSHGNELIDREQLTKISTVRSCFFISEIGFGFFLNDRLKKQNENSGYNTIVIYAILLLCSCNFIFKTKKLYYQFYIQVNILRNYWMHLKPTDSNKKGGNF